MSNIIQFPWEHTAEGRAQRKLELEAKYPNFDDASYTFSHFIDWSLMGPDAEADNDYSDEAVVIEHTGLDAVDKYTHRVMNLLGDIEHLALAALSKGEDHDVAWLEHQLDQIRATMAIGVIPLGDDDDEDD